MSLFQRLPWLRSWETLLLILLVVIVGYSAATTPNYLSADSISDMFRLSIEKAIVVIIMAFVIINAEIDLSVASVMALSASLLAYSYEQGAPVVVGIVLALLVGALCGAINGFFIAYLKISSLVVTLAGLIMYRGFARIVLEDRSIGDFPDWFTSIANDGFIGMFPFTIVIFVVLFAIAYVILQYSTFGRYVYAVGNNLEASEYAGIKVRRVKMQIFIASATISALAGILLAARGDVNAGVAEGFELDIITIVLLGGVSIFGGRGTMLGVGLGLLVVLSLRNGMRLNSVVGQTQSMVVGLLLILSVLIPNLATSFQTWWVRQSFGDEEKSKANGGGVPPTVTQ